MTFSVRCPSCDTSFPIDPEKVPDPGVYAICSVCEETFLVRREELDEGGFAVAGDADTVASSDYSEPAEFGDADPSESWSGSTSWRDEAGDTGLDEAVDEASAVETTVQEPVGPDHVLEETVLETSVLEETAFAGAVASDPIVEEVAEELPRPAFGKGDPHERAQRLARVLVSDMIAYHPDRHAKSIEDGTLPEDFEDEIQKSWNEYVDQVGAEMADATPYFTDALNKVLARGQEIF